MDIEARMKEEWEREGEENRYVGKTQPAPTFVRRQLPLRLVRRFYRDVFAGGDPSYDEWVDTGIYHGWL
jgi:hypothetical protein